MRDERIVAAVMGVMLATAVSATGAFAQGGVFGVKGGLTLASADVEDIEGTFDTGNRTGWAAGAFFSMGSGALSIQPELNLINLGFEATGLPGSPDVELRYFAPAVLLRLGLPLAVVRPGLLAGVGVGIEIDCQIGGATCDDADPSLETQTTDPTGLFGADLDVAFGMGVLRAEARYLIGLRDIHEASDVWTEIKNRAWQVQAGFGFRF